MELKPKAVERKLDDPAVAFVPYDLKLKGRKLKDVGLDELDWPIGRPKSLIEGHVSDLLSFDHVITPPHLWVYANKSDISPANLTLMIVEPRAYHAKHIFLAKLFYRRFYRVLSCDEALLVRVPNSDYLIAPHTFVPDWNSINCSKTKLLSLIASKKKQLVGHKLRHKIARSIRDKDVNADVIGGGYQPFEHKADGLAPYRYSVVIENSRQFGYFTEKLIDALLLKTVPIYWGAPDIRMYFDTRGMIVCHNETEILAAISRLSESDYESRRAFIDENCKRAQRFQDFRPDAAEIVKNAG